MPPTQYPKSSEMTLVARLKLVGTLHGRGFSAARIARELDYSPSQARIDVAAVIDRYKDFEDLDEHLRDVTARTGEQLTKLNELEATLWKQLDWATEWVVQVDGFGAVMHEIGEDGERKSEPMYGPRKPGQVSQIVGQIQAINKQQAELLGLLNKNVDISVKLQQTERIQLIMVEIIKETDPTLYSQLRRRIQAEMASVQPVAIPSAGVGRDIEAVSGEYQSLR